MRERPKPLDPRSTVMALGLSCTTMATTSRISGNESDVIMTISRLVEALIKPDVDVEDNGSAKIGRFRK